MATGKVVSGKFRKHTKESMKAAARNRFLDIADIIDASFELWLEANEKTRARALKSAARRTSDSLVYTKKIIP